MLNRRILRVKAMQALYSYHLTRESLKDVVRERLESHFYPDPAKDDFSESGAFEKKRKLASRLYDEYLEDGQVNGTENLDSDIEAEVNEALNHYKKELRSEERSIRRYMIGDLDELKKLYLKLVLLATELAHVEKLEKERKEKSFTKKEQKAGYHFINNPVIDELTKFEEFNKEVISRKISWTEDLETLRMWYRDIISKDEEIISYQAKDSPTIEEHKQAIVHFYKKLVFKNETIDDFLGEIDLRWSENKPILRSLVVKTFQDFEPELNPPIELKAISRNAEDDIPFFEKLFDQALQNDKELDHQIAENVKNWDLSRVALTDLIILKLAITEMRLFPSIPVKVSINEFIEISKTYSTPKSKQFVNGILDVLANELTSKGVIKKSGRGLIDNK